MSWATLTWGTSGPTWVGLMKGIQEGVVFYTYPGEHVDNTTGLLEEGNFLDFKPLEKIEVQWPDGHEEIMVLAIRPCSTLRTSMEYGVYVNVHGVPAWVDLSHVKIRFNSIPRKGS